MSGSLWFFFGEVESAPLSHHKRLQIQRHSPTGRDWLRNVESDVRNACCQISSLPKARGALEVGDVVITIAFPEREAAPGKAETGACRNRLLHPPTHANPRKITDQHDDCACDAFLCLVTALRSRRLCHWAKTEFGEVQSKLACD